MSLTSYVRSSWELRMMKWGGGKNLQHMYSIMRREILRYHHSMGTPTTGGKICQHREWQAQWHVN